MKSKLVDPNTLTLSKNNVRKTNPKEYFGPLLTSVLNCQEILEPIIVNQHNEVVAGQRRWLAAKEANIKVPVIIKEYSNDVEEIYDSLIENDLQYPLNAKDLVDTTVLLHDKYGETFRSIANKMGRRLPTIYAWYKSGKGPQPLSDEQIKKELEEEVREQEVVEPKYRKFEESEEIEREKKKREVAAKEAREVFSNLSIRKSNVVSSILKKAPWDIYDRLQFMEYAKVAPLREIEDIQKNMRAKLPVNMEFRKELIEHRDEYEYRTWRVPKVLVKRATPILRRLNLDWNQALIEAFTAWVEKNEL